MPFWRHPRPLSHYTREDIPDDASALFEDAEREAKFERLDAILTRILKIVSIVGIVMISTLTACLIAADISTGGAVRHDIRRDVYPSNAPSLLSRTPEESTP